MWIRSTAIAVCIAMTCVIPVTRASETLTLDAAIARVVRHPDLQLLGLSPGTVLAG